MMQSQHRVSFFFFVSLALWCSGSVLLPATRVSAAEEIVKKGLDQPVIVNGDTVEYSTDNREVVASGNVEVIYKGARLTCRKLTVNMLTKDATAEGNARVEDDRGVIEGDKIFYNFDTKKGSIVDAQFRSSPYFIKAKELQRVNESEFMGTNGSATTCSMDHPHYRIGAKKIKMVTNDTIRTRDDVLYLGNTPMVYLPGFSRSLKDSSMHVQLTPGKSGEWGPYLLASTRYNLTDYVNGRLYLDYREKLGMAEGAGFNYRTPEMGKGDFKFYYTHETPQEFQGTAHEAFQRYLIRWRHKWDIDPYTNYTSEFLKIDDAKRRDLGPPYNMLKDYFRREFDSDEQPLSYVLFHHNFSQSSLDAIVQPRVNSWYSELEKIPEIDYSLNNSQIGETPFYFQNNSQAAMYNFKNAAPSPSSADVFVTRFDTTNKISLPSRVAFVALTPFVAHRETFYDRNSSGESFWAHPRSIFYAGADASTKFYRIFDIQTNAFGLDINSLRHIITPTIGHAFNHEPTQPSSKLKQIDTVDALTRNNTTSFELDNKLQTKRGGMSVDILDFRAKSSYAYKPKGGRGGSFSDYIFELDAIPYSWMRLNANADYNHYEDFFANANYDLNFTFAGDRTISLGQRYDKIAGDALTFASTWRLSPKWKFGIYERFQMKQSTTVKKGLREQEYTFTRDLHCWEMDITYNVQDNSGESIWFIFRLKAFPEVGFNFNQTYHSPKPGSQSQP